MINSTSKTDSILRLNPILPKPAQASASIPTSVSTDTMSASSQATLKEVLKNQPEIRPEMISSGQKLAVDGNYPPKEIIRRLSELLVRSVDLSE